MILIDANVFLIDRFFLRDALYPNNRLFIERLEEFEAAVSTFTVLEVCGVAGFNLSELELRRWLSNFSDLYPVSVLNPFGLKDQTASDWMREFLRNISERISRKMTFGDALLLREAERYEIQAIVSWNTRDFSNRTKVPLFTPESYLRALKE